MGALLGPAVDDDATDGAAPTELERSAVGGAGSLFGVSPRFGVSRLGVSRLGVSRFGVSRLGVSRRGASTFGVSRLGASRRGVSPIGVSAAAVLGRSRLATEGAADEEGVVATAAVVLRDDELPALCLGRVGAAGLRLVGVETEGVDDGALGGRVGDAEGEAVVAAPAAAVTCGGGCGALDLLGLPLEETALVMLGLALPFAGGAIREVEVEVVDADAVGGNDGGARDDDDNDDDDGCVGGGGASASDDCGGRARGVDEEDGDDDGDGAAVARAATIAAVVQRGAALDAARDACDAAPFGVPLIRGGWGEGEGGGSGGRV